MVLHLQLSNQLGIWFAERTCRELVALTQFCKRRRRCRPHVARPRPIAEMHTSRLFCEFERKMTQQVPRKSDEIFKMRVVKTLRILPSLWSEKPCTANRAINEPSSLNLTTQRIFIRANGEIPLTRGRVACRIPDKRTEFFIFRFDNFTSLFSWQRRHFQNLRTCELKVPFGLQWRTEIS